MKYIEIVTGKPVQASKGYMSNYGGVVVQQPDVWVVLGLGGVTLRSEEGFKEDYTLAVEEPEKPETKRDTYFGGIIECTNDSRKRDAEAYASLDVDMCQICGAQGQDKRSFAIRCLYDMKEIAPEFLSLWHVAKEDGEKGLFYLRLCKSCRGTILGAMNTAINERRGLRSQKLDHDGYPALDDD